MSGSLIDRHKQATLYYLTFGFQPDVLPKIYTQTQIRAPLLITDPLRDKILKFLSDKGIIITLADGTFDLFEERYRTDDLSKEDHKKVLDKIVEVLVNSEFVKNPQKFYDENLKKDFRQDYVKQKFIESMLKVGIPVFSEDFDVEELEKCLKLFKKHQIPDKKALIATLFVNHPDKIKKLTREKRMALGQKKYSQFNEKWLDISNEENKAISGCKPYLFSKEMIINHQTSSVISEIMDLIKPNIILSGSPKTRKEIRKSLKKGDRAIISRSGNQISRSYFDWWRGSSIYFTISMDSPKDGQKKLSVKSEIVFLPEDKFNELWNKFKDDFDKLPDTELDKYNLITFPWI